MGGLFLVSEGISLVFGPEPQPSINRVLLCSLQSKISTCFIHGLAYFFGHPFFAPTTMDPPIWPGKTQSPQKIMLRRNSRMLWKLQGPWPPSFFVFCPIRCSTKSSRIGLIRKLSTCGKGWYLVKLTNFLYIFSIKKRALTNCGHIWLLSNDHNNCCIVLDFPSSSSTCRFAVKPPAMCKFQLHFFCNSIRFSNIWVNHDNSPTPPISLYK